MAMNRQFKSMRSDVKKQAATKKTGSGGTKFSLPEGVTFFNPKKGTTKMVIVPYTVSINKHPAGREKGDLWYERRFLMHYNIGADPKSYVCPKSIGQRCPICEYRMRLSKSENPNEETLKELKPKERVLYNVHDVDGDENNVMLWDVSFHNFTKKLEEEITEGPDEYGDFPNPDESGMVLSVRFSDKTLGKTTFLEASRIDFKERGYELPDELLESALDLDKILKILPYEELERIYLEINDEDNDGDTSSSTPPAKDKEVEKPKPEKKETKAKEQEKPSEPEVSEEDKEKARKEAVREAKRREKEAQESGDECPAGGKFGVDTDNLKACDTCPKWDACIAKKEG